MSGPDLTVLSTDECWARLREAPYGRLAVVVGFGGPDIFPVNHVVDRGSLVFRTAEGTKLHAASGQLVAFEIDGREGETAWSVVAKGRAHQIRQIHDAVDALELGVTPWQGGAKPVFVRIDPEQVTGRRFRIHDDA